MSGAHSHAGHRCGNEAAEGQPSETSASSRRSGAMAVVVEDEVEDVEVEVEVEEDEEDDEEAVADGAWALISMFTAIGGA